MNCESAQRVQSVFVVSRLSAANTRKTDDSLGFKWGSAMLKTCVKTESQCLWASGQLNLH